MYFNQVYIPYLTNRKRYLILYGGTDSGKSVFAAQKILYRIGEEKNHRILLIRKFQREIRQSQYHVFKTQIYDNNVQDAFNFKPSYLSIDCPHRCEILGAGVDDPEKLKSIHDITAIWIEEASEISADDFEEINRRLRGLRRYYKQIILTFNPIHPSSWLKSMFFDPDSKYRDQAAILRTTYRENVFVDPEDAKRYESYTGRMRSVYTIGEWGDISDPDQVIPFELILKAYEIKPIDGARSLGVDVARYGDDKTILLEFNGNHIQAIDEYEEIPIDRTADLVLIKMVNNRINADSVGIDGVGLGAGVVDILKRKRFNVQDIIAGASPIPDDSNFSYYDLRAQMWWNARIELENGNISLMKDIKLVGDLTSPRYTIERDKKIRVESKQDIKARIGRSTDRGDAFVQALFVRKIKAKKYAKVTML